MQKPARKRFDAACSIAAVLSQLLLLLPHEMRRLRKARASRLVCDDDPAAYKQKHWS